MDKFSEMSHAERIAYLASKVALAKSYDSPVLTVPIPDLELVLAELEREQGMRAQNLEIKTLLAEKVKGLETKLWDSQQLVDAKSGSQIELRSQISSLEESNRKDMAWREERLCELEDSLEAAQERISELEAKLATPVRLPERFSMLHRADFHEDYHSTMAFKADGVIAALREHGSTVEGDE